MCQFDSINGALSGPPHQVTNLSTGADGGTWSPDGKNIVFVSSVYPDCPDDACNKKRDEELSKSKVKAKIFNHLFYRHWNAFTEFKRSHLFVIAAENDTSQPNPGAARDLTPGDHDVPPFHLGGADMYDVSPDGQEVAYTSNIDEVEATSTSNDIFIVPIAGGPAKKISTSPGSDATPRYSPNGANLAWKSMARAGYESDHSALLIYDRKSGDLRDLTRGLDRSVGSVAWAPDSSAVFFTAEDHGTSPIWQIALEGDRPVEVAHLHADDIVFGRQNQLYFSRSSVTAPAEIARIDVSGLKHDSARPKPLL